MSQRRWVELEEVRDLSPSVRSLGFRCVDGGPFEFVAGQWVNLDVETPAGAVRRAYSIASRPDRSSPGRFELGVTLVDGGAASQALHSMAAGGRLEMDGPHGFFTREGLEDQPALFVGTGSGLCPLRSMIASALESPGGPPMTLLFGCRTPDDILWREELEAWSQSGRLALHVTLSRPASDWRGLAGYVQSHLTRVVDPASKPHVFICGLSRMVKEVRSVLKAELGYDRRLIHSERYD